MRLVLLFPALVILGLLTLVFSITIGKVVQTVQAPQVQPVTGLVVEKQVNVQGLIADPRGFANLSEENASPSPLP